MSRARSLAVRTMAAMVLAGACLTTAASPPAQASFPGKTGRIAFFDFTTGQIYAVNPDGTALVQLTHEPDGIWARWPDWSPDGTHLLFVRYNPANGAGRIWIMRADGSAQHRLASDAPGYRDYEPRYTPDGRRIVFARCQPGDGVCAIWIMRSNGTAKRAITPFKEGTREAVDFDIAVSPDGHRVAYTAFGQHGVAARIHIVDMTGANNHAVGPPALEAAQSDWSPNGARIVFTSNIVRLNDNLYTMAPDGSDLVQLTTARYPHGNYAAAFSPEGNQIAFFSDRHYPDLCCEDLFIMNADGSGQHLVPTGLTGGFEPAWGTSPVLPATTPSRITHPAAEPGSASMAREAPCRGLPEILARALC